MKIKIIAVGKIKDTSILNLSQKFERRIKYNSQLKIIIIKDSSEQIETEKLLHHINKTSGFYIALTEEGKQFDSKSFARFLNKQKDQVSFIIGGPSGLSEKIKKRCDVTLALSSMTFTHEMARLFLSEQIYRAITIIQNKKYHKN